MGGQSVKPINSAVVRNYAERILRAYKNVRMFCFEETGESGIFSIIDVT